MTTPVNVFGDKKSAAEWVKQQKALWGDGVATLCIFYNGTGEELNIVKDSPNSKYGHFYDHVDPPPVVENGQWGAFLHVQQDDVTTVSEGFVEYKDTSTLTIELLGWMTTRSKNIVHCDIFDAKVDPPPPDQIYKDIETNPQSDVKKFGMHVIATLEADHGQIISTYIITRDVA